MTDVPVNVSVCASAVVMNSLCLFAVRSNLYHLLGIFAAVFPEYMVKYSNKLLGVYVGSLKAEVTLLLQLVIWYDCNCYLKFFVIIIF